MAQATLDIDLGTIAANWRSPDAASGPSARTAAVVKADACGPGAKAVAKALARSGVRTFFVAMAEEGSGLRQALRPGPRIFVFGGHMADDADTLKQHELFALLYAPLQITRHRQTLPGHRFAVQIDTGINRRGIDALASAAGIIPYESRTALGPRYAPRDLEAEA